MLWLVRAWRRYIRLLQTRRSRVRALERAVRAGLLAAPYFGVAWLLHIRAKFWGPLIVDAESVDGVRLRCTLPDLIPTYVYLFGTWEPDVVDFIARRLRPGDTFIDVGANIGCLSALAAEKVGPHGLVVSIEPSPQILTNLRHTKMVNGYSHLRIVETAVSDRDHDMTLFAGPSTNTGMTSTVAHLGFTESGTVRAAPLQALVTGRELATSRLIKVDVEGAEDRVLRGMLSSVDMLSAEAELVIELSPEWWAEPALRPIDVLQPFFDRGFHPYMLPNSYWPWRYLWPRDVVRPRRIWDLTSLESRSVRLDLVLSRVDSDSL